MCCVVRVDGRTGPVEDVTVIASKLKLPGAEKADLLGLSPP
jgi:hypothetical protein